MAAFTRGSGHGAPYCEPGEPRRGRPGLIPRGQLRGRSGVLLRVERMRTWSRLGVLSRWVAALALACGVVTGTAAADPIDPPGRAARLSDVEGSVAVQPAG